MRKSDCRLLVALAMLLVGCRPLTMPPPQPLAPASSPTAAPHSSTAADCPETLTIKDEPPRDPNADPFGYGDWFVNADRTLWAGAPSAGYEWRAGGEKVIWIRPAGAELVISGHRLDAQAPPVRADIPCCYPTGFQVTGLIFPTEGCWEVTAKSGESELRFVVQVTPAEQSPTDGPCESLADIVKRSDAIALGRVTDTDSEGDYAWHTVTVMSTWKLPPGWSMIGDWFSLLQNLRTEPALQENGRYVLFLQHDPWQLVCAQRSLMEAQGDQLIPIGDNPMWPGGTARALRAEVDRLLAEP